MAAGIFDDKAILIAVISGALAGPVACTQSDAARELGADDLVFGLPEAEVFIEDYTGPPVVGEFVTMAPHIADLPPGNRTHDVRLDIIAQEVEVAPDVRFVAWTFGGSVPGPVLHVRQGDTVQFVMRNRSDEPVAVTEPMAGTAPFLSQVARSDPQSARDTVYPSPHSLDFHAATVAADDKWRTIQPGESIRYMWVANYPGVYMYHCGTSPVLAHVAMGQYGTVVVSPRDGFPTDGQVDRAYVLIQSEFYLQEDDDDGLHTLDYDAAMQKQPSIVAFNGHSERHVRTPLTAYAGERLRFYLLNAGPSDTWSFHVIGGLLDTVWLHGNPSNELRGLQTILLGASVGGVVEMIVPEDGLYYLVDHEFADMQKGALGHLVAAAPDG